MLVVNGDVPLVTAEALRALARAHGDAGAAATTATMVLDDPTGYGRVVRAADGSVARVVETKHPGDATPEELALREVNAGVYAFDAAALRGALDRLTTDNAQGEHYLPDVLRCWPTTAGGSRPTSSTTRRCCSASTTASSSPASARSPRRGSSRRTSAPA